MHELYRRGPLLQMSHVACSLCSCAGHTGELWKNGSTDQDAVGSRTDSGETKHIQERSVSGCGPLGDGDLTICRMVHYIRG